MSLLPEIICRNCTPLTRPKYSALTESTTISGTERLLPPALAIQCWWVLFSGDCDERRKFSHSYDGWNYYDCCCCDCGCFYHLGFPNHLQLYFRRLIRYRRRRFQEAKKSDLFIRHCFGRKNRPVHTSSWRKPVCLGLRVPCNVGDRDRTTGKVHDNTVRQVGLRRTVQSQQEERKCPHLVSTFRRLKFAAAASGYRIQLRLLDPIASHVSSANCPTICRSASEISGVTSWAPELK